MALQTPKTDWDNVDIPLPKDFNRIEGNIKELETSKVAKGCTWGDLKGVPE
jgi:hypothetical protein